MNALADNVLKSVAIGFNHSFGVVKIRRGDKKELRACTEPPSVTALLLSFLTGDSGVHMRGMPWLVFGNAEPTYWLALQHQVEAAGLLAGNLTSGVFFEPGIAPLRAQSQARLGLRLFLEASPAPFALTHPFPPHPIPPSPKSDNYMAYAAIHVLMDRAASLVATTVQDASTALLLCPPEFLRSASQLAVG